MLAAAGTEALELGLLMTEEQDITSEDDEELYSFQHKLIHEFLAALYVSQEITLNVDFLNENFATCRDIEKHIEVISFCINIIASSSKDAQSIVTFATGMFAERVGKQLANGELGMVEMYEVQSALLPMQQAFSGSQEVKEAQFLDSSCIYISTSSDLHSPTYSLFLSHCDRDKGETKLKLLQNTSQVRLLNCCSSIGSTNPEEHNGANHFAAIERQKHLQKICSCKCEIQDIGMRFLISRISGITLRSCNLSGSWLGLGVQHITEAMKSGLVKTMESCDFSDCAIPASALVSFISELHNWPNLREVNLSKNAFQNIELMVKVENRKSGAFYAADYQNRGPFGSKLRALGLILRAVWGQMGRLSRRGQMGRPSRSSPCHGRSSNNEIQAKLFKQIENCEHIFLYSEDTDADDLVAVVQNCKSVVLSKMGRFQLDNDDWNFDQSIQSSSFHNSCVNHIGHAISIYDGLKIENLDLSQAKCESDNLHSLLRVLHKCKNLKSLILTEPDLAKHLSATLPESLHIAHLIPGLDELDVRGNDISNSLRLLTDNTLTSLVKLDISKCSLALADIEALASAFAARTFPMLQDMNLSGNDFSNSLHLLTEHGHINLFKLDVKQCSLTRADIKSLTGAIQARKFPKLREVDLLRKDLSHSLDLVPQLPGIRERFDPCLQRGHQAGACTKKPFLPSTPYGAKVTSKAFPKNKTVNEEDRYLSSVLEVGSFRSNREQYRFTGTHHLSRHLTFSPSNLENANMKYIIKWGCNLSIEYITDLAAVIKAGKIPNLQVLNLSCNENLSQSLHLFTKHTYKDLVKLNVSWCKLTNADIEALAAAIKAGRFPKLQEVDAEGNDLSQSLHLLHLIPIKKLCLSNKDISNSLHLLTEHGHINLVKLDVKQCSLTRADIKLLTDAIEAGRFPKLQEIDMLRKDLSNSLDLVPRLPGIKERFDPCFERPQDAGACKNEPFLPPTPHGANVTSETFPEEEMVDEEEIDFNQSLHHTDIASGILENLNMNSISMFHPQSLNCIHRLPGLERLHVRRKDISSLHLLTEHVQPSLVHLSLWGCNLAGEDITALAAAIEAGRFPNLQVLNLGRNENLSQSLHLFTKHTYKNLVKLNVRWCELTNADIEALAAAIKAGRFPKLQEVDAVGNDLSQSLHLLHLLPIKNLRLSNKDISNSLHKFIEHMPTSLDKLYLSSTNITRADILALTAALKTGRLPCLRWIDLDGNDLNNSLYILTGHVQNSLCDLHVSKCNLVAADISALAAALTAGRLPHLGGLYLSLNDLVDNSVQPLCKALMQYAGSAHCLAVGLLRNKLSDTFKNKWRGKLRHNTSVNLII